MLNTQSGDSSIIVDDPWIVDEQDFPSSGSLAEQLTFLLNYAVLAPSGHNTQPWLFRVGSSQVDVFADRSRALAVVDPEDRELVMSCAAAAFHLKAALAHYERVTEIMKLPDPGDPDLLLRVEVTGSREPTLTDHRLFMAIQKRHTNRQSFEDRPIPEIELSSMKDAAADEGVRLDLFTESTPKMNLGRIIAAADRIQGRNSHFRRELAAWVRTNTSRRKDGIPGYAVGVGDLMSFMGPLVVRTFDWGGGQAAKNEQLALGSPVLAVFSTERDDVESWLSAGLALDHVLLLAADYAIQASHLNQPLEVERLRSRVSALLPDGGFPQIILRMGYGDLSRPTPRRPVAEVLLD